jgi:uncharacterized protein (TIGR03083 family)
VVADPGPWLRSVRRSHDRLAAQVQALTPADLGARSYCPEWTIADVLSHLGSQAEIFSLFVDAGLGGGDAPDQSAFQPVWDSWNSRAPEDQAADSVTANEQLVSRLENLEADALRSFRLDMFGMSLDAAGLLRMRLSEHAVHAWDIAVALDPAAVIAPDAVDLIIDGLPEMAARAGKPAPEPATVMVRTSEPDRRFALQTDGVSLEPQAGTADDGDDADDGWIELPAESLIRLVYGRLDGVHRGAEPVTAPTVSLDQLRSLFPGF